MDREGKFADASLYRWVLQDVSSQVQTGNFSNPSASAEDFYFYDRLRDKRYPATGKGSFRKIISFKPVINTIVKDCK